MNVAWVELVKHIVPQIEVLLVVVLVDFLMGVASALKSHTFDANKLPDWLAHYGLRMLGWLGLEALAVIPEEYLINAGITRAMGDGALALIVASGLASILKSARELGIAPNLSKPTGDVE